MKDKVSAPSDLGRPGKQRLAPGLPRECECTTQNE
jgi:hypothetical protein